MTDTLNRHETIFGVDRSQATTTHDHTSAAVCFGARYRDMWWASIGENVGSEMDGKNDRFSRPVLILKKLTHGFYFIAPTTTQPRHGSWYVHIHLGDQEEFVCLHQVRVIDYRRLHSKLGQIDTDNFKKVKDGFLKLYL